MPVLAPSKYALKSLHEDIALFDRKIAHLEKYETFASAEERSAAAGKMASKREQLIRAAKVMTDAGIQFEPAVPVHAASEEIHLDVPATASATSRSAVTSLQFAEPSQGGTPLDFRNSIAEYKKRRMLNT